MIGIALISTDNHRQMIEQLKDFRYTPVIGMYNGRLEVSYSVHVYDLCISGQRYIKSTDAERLVKIAKEHTQESVLFVLGEAPYRCGYLHYTDQDVLLPFEYMGKEHVSNILPDGVDSWTYYPTTGMYVWYG